jgi:hypothetical protein
MLLIKTLKTGLIDHSIPLPPLMNGFLPPPGNANTTFILQYLSRMIREQLQLPPDSLRGIHLYHMEGFGKHTFAAVPLALGPLFKVTNSYTCKYRAGKIPALLLCTELHGKIRRPRPQRNPGACPPFRTIPCCSLLILHCAHC